MPWKNDQVSELETEKIIEIAQESLTVPGDFVEFGCYRGDTSLMLAEILKDYNTSFVEKPVENFGKKRLWLYDSFEGLPKKTAEDGVIDEGLFKSGALLASKRELKIRFLKAGLPLPIIKKAWFNELVDSDLPSAISFAFLDGDFYGSIKTSLHLINQKMQTGGVIIVHDYGNATLPGVATAVDEWLKTHGGYACQIYQSMIMMKR